MTSAAIREQLHHFIDTADDRKVAAIYDLLQKEMSGGKYTADDVAGFYKTLDQYKNGEMPVYTVQEAHEYVREQYDRAQAKISG